jgi:hypothetical protein
MERLTNKREADAQRKEYERRLANGYPRNIPEERFLRLAAYEDTHMMPSDVTSMRMDMAIIAALFDGVDVDRMKELTEADKDGRLVVLPCKVGQRVFALLDTDTHISECEVKQIGMGNKIGFIGLEPIGARGREYGVSLNGFGKTVFLTREEAEKALEAMKDG